MATDWTICVIQMFKKVDNVITRCVDIFRYPIGMAKSPQLHFITHPTT